jgi:hypothetical protein
MDIQQLRQSLKMKWLSYYEENRLWLVKAQIWHTYDDIRRPSSGYILATLSVLEPELQQMLPLILDLNQDPDRIISALGLDFNPDQELCLLESPASPVKNQIVDVSDGKKTSVDLVVTANQQVLFKIARGTERNQQPISVVSVTTLNHHAPGKIATSEKSHQTNFREQNTWRTIGDGIPRSLLTESSLHPSTQIHHKGNSEYISLKASSPKSPTTTGVSTVTHARNLSSWIDESCSGVGW